MVQEILPLIAAQGAATSCLYAMQVIIITLRMVSDKLILQNAKKPRKADILPMKKSNQRNDQQRILRTQDSTQYARTQFDHHNNNEGD